MDGSLAARILAANSVLIASRLSDGLIAEEWAVSDLAEHLLREIG